MFKPVLEKDEQLKLFQFKLYISTGMQLIYWFVVLFWVASLQVVSDMDKVHSVLGSI